jgi:hypothetical protein
MTNGLSRIQVNKVLLQMTLLPPLSVWIVHWWAGRSATKGSI